MIDQLIRPTGLLDPLVEVRPREGYRHDLLSEIARCVREGDRVLVTTLTKVSAEELCEFLEDQGVRAKYMHSDIKAEDRVEIINGLRAGEFDVLVGISLLREGLDIPEASLVAIVDADQAGFLRSSRALIQMIDEPQETRAVRRSCMPIRSLVRCGRPFLRLMTGDSIRSRSMRSSASPRQRLAECWDQQRLDLTGRKPIQRSSAPT